MGRKTDPDGYHRLPELAGGWGNPRMRNEMQFLVLDGL